MNNTRFTGTMWLVVGLLLGLVTGLIVRGLWTPVPVFATATDGQDNFAIATGFVDEDTEAMFFLDFLTGDLRATVPGRQNGKFTSFFETNIMADFGSSGNRGKNPKFLLVTGRADFGGSSSNTQVARSVVYVAEATSGEVACYGLPWNRTAYSANRPQKGNFVLLDKRPFRTTVIRD